MYSQIGKNLFFHEEGLDARALITKTDKKGITTFASPAYRAMTKYSKSELIGNPHSIVDILLCRSRLLRKCGILFYKPSRGKGLL